MSKSPLELATNKIVATAQGLTDENQNPDKLRAFKSSVLWWLRELVTMLGLKRGTYDLWYDNDQGVLKTADFSMNVNLRAILLPDRGLGYQACNGMTDFVGGPMQWLAPLATNIAELPGRLKAFASGDASAKNLLQNQEVLQV